MPRQKHSSSKAEKLLRETAGKNSIAEKMLNPPEGRQQSIIKFIEDELDGNDLTNENAASTLVESMMAYLSALPISPALRQPFWDECSLWYARILDRIGVECVESFETYVPRPMEGDLTIRLIKSLHSNDFINKSTLAEELGVSAKSIQTDLRRICPELQQGGKTPKPSRIGGQLINVPLDIKRDNVSGEVSYRSSQRMSPLVLQLNTIQVATLLQSLFGQYYYVGNNISQSMAVDIWSQLSNPVKDRIKKVFGEFDTDFKDFLSELGALSTDPGICCFRTERELTDYVSISEQLLIAYKGGEVCGITLQIGGERRQLKNQRIYKCADDYYKALPKDAPRESEGILFRAEDVRDYITFQ